MRVRLGRCLLYLLTVLIVAVVCIQKFMQQRPATTTNVVSPLQYGSNGVDTLQTNSQAMEPRGLSHRRTVTQLTTKGSEQLLRERYGVQRRRPSDSAIGYNGYLDSRGPEGNKQRTSANTSQELSIVKHLHAVKPSDSSVRSQRMQISYLTVINDIRFSEHKVVESGAKDRLSKGAKPEVRGERVTHNFKQNPTLNQNVSVKNESMMVILTDPRNVESNVSELKVANLKSSHHALQQNHEHTGLAGLNVTKPQSSSSTMPSRQHRVKDLRINETMENLMPDLNYSPGAFSCYPASSLADYNIEQTALPSFTLDMSLYIVSTVISVKHSNVYFITIDKNSKGLYVDKNVRSRMDSSTSGLACLYSDGRQWKVSATSDVDGGDVRVLSCHLPRYMHDCFITEYAESSMTIPLCVNIWLVRYKRATKKTIKREFRIIASLKGCVPAKRQHDQLAICAPPVTEEEWLILPEWLEYHLLVGFQHFYLYTTNGRRDQLSSKLKNYILQGIVSVRSWMSQPWTRLARNLQSLSARNDCLYRSKDRAKWLAFADVDEYFYPVNSDDVREIVESYHNKTKHDVIKMKKGYFRRPADTKVGKRLLIESYRRADLHRYSGRESFVIKPSNVSLINMQSDDITPATVNGHVSVNATTIRVNHYRSDYSNGSQLDSGMKRFIPRVKIHICRRSGQCRQQ